MKTQIYGLRVPDAFRAFLLTVFLLISAGTAYGALDVTAMSEDQLKEEIEKRINKLEIPRLTGLVG